MKLTTICYIEKDRKYLMLHRIKKENDQSHNKWLGVGGKFEGKLTECNEGELVWVEKPAVLNLNLWEGDVLFLKRLIEDEKFFTIKVQYQGEKLVYAKEKIS